MSCQVGVDETLLIGQPRTPRQRTTDFLPLHRAAALLLIMTAEDWHGACTGRWLASHRCCQ
jgi:hypothetical protein